MRQLFHSLLVRKFSTVFGISFQTSTVKFGNDRLVAIIHVKKTSSRLEIFILTIQTVGLVVSVSDY